MDKPPSEARSLPGFASLISPPTEVHSVDRAKTPNLDLQVGNHILTIFMHIHQVDALQKGMYPVPRTLMKVTILKRVLRILQIGWIHFHSH